MLFVSSPFCLSLSSGCSATFSAVCTAAGEDMRLKKRGMRYDYGHSLLSSFISHPGSSNLSFLASSAPHSTLSSLTSTCPSH